MNKKTTLFAVFATFAFAATFVLGGNAGLYENVDVEAGNVRVYKNGDLIAEQKNVLMDGEEAIESQIKSGEAASWDMITLGDGAAPTDSSSTLDSEYTDCGMSPTTATVEDTGDGSWNLTATFTSTCDDIVVNTTAQYSSGASANNYFAGTGFGRDINLYSGDELTVEWSNTVS